MYMVEFLMILIGHSGKTSAHWLVWALAHYPCMDRCMQLGQLVEHLSSTVCAICSWDTIYHACIEGYKSIQIVQVAYRVWH